MSEHPYDLVVIGAGPGGYVAAIRAAQLGMKVAIIDKNSYPGGTCLRIGCIPSKALLESSEQYAIACHELKEHGITAQGISLDLQVMMDRKAKVVSNLAQGIRSLLKKNRIDHYTGTASFHDPSTITVTENGTSSMQFRGNHILIATGSRSKSLPKVKIDGKTVVTSTEALSFPKIPQHLVVIGAGAIGLELGSVWNRLGSQVTVLEFMNRILPGIDSEIAGQAEKVFAKQGMTFRLETKVSGVESREDHCRVIVEGSSPIECERVLVAVGREPNTDGLDLDRAGVDTDDKGRIPVNKHYQTNVESIFAIGDVIPGPMLAHKAEEEGIALAEHLAHVPSHVDYNAIPNVVYTQPEIASVGLAEDRIRAQKQEYNKGTFPFRANGRAQALGTTQGMVKVLADRKTDRILGVHILGPRAGELINEAASAITFGASSEDLGRCCHAHPTLSEAMKEAALAASNRAIHL